MTDCHDGRSPDRAAAPGGGGDRQDAAPAVRPRHGGSGIHVHVRGERDQLRKAEQRGGDGHDDQRASHPSVVDDASVAYSTTEVQGSEQNQREGRKQRRDAYDVAVLAIAFLALIAAGAAAWFTWDQAETAREQTRRSLRAYVVVEAELVRSNGGAQAKLAAENMGQTPVYDLSYFVDAVAVEPSEPLPSLSDFQTRCGALRLAEWGAPFATFSKTFEHRVRVSSMFFPPDDAAAYLRDDRRIYVYGTACYRDIFGQAHAFRFCYAWTSFDGGAGRCAIRE